jgi:membrane fusion protein, multidrug efflux system
LRLSLILAVLVLLAGCGKNDTVPVKAASRAAAPVVVARVEQRTIPVEVRAIGNVEAFSTIQVKAEVGGELQKVGFTEGDTVHKGQVLFEIDPRPQQETIRQLEANLARDSAQAANARADASRYSELYKQGIVARQQFEQSNATADALEATLASDRAAISNAQLQLLYCQIKSPIDGRTGNLLVKEGNLVKANDIPMVVINQVHPIYVTFAVPERELPEIRRRIGSGLTVIAKQPDGSTSVGKLSFIENTVDQTTGTIKMKATFPNSDDRLWPGQFVSVTLTVSSESNAIIVPSQAVQIGQKGQYVYVVTDGKALYRAIEVGRDLGDSISIRAGLTKGESVVIDGQSRVTPGAPVQVVKGQ